MTRLLLALLLVLANVPSAVAQTCTGFSHVMTHNDTGLQTQGWTATNSPAVRQPLYVQFWATHGAAVGRARWPDDATYTYSGFSADPPPNGCSTTLRATRTHRVTGATSSASAVTSCSTVTTPNQCPPDPDECDTNHSNFGSSFTGLGLDDLCDEDSHCKAKAGNGACGGGVCVSTFTIVNESCSVGDPTSPNPPPNDESCVTGGEAEFCKSGQDSDDPKNCGFLNGNFVCLDQTDNDGCQVFGDGSRVCGPNAPTPPVPDNGTPGQPASPDGSISSTNSSGTTNIYNYYNNTTVASSNRNPGASGDNPYDGEDDGTGAGSGLNSAGNSTRGGNGSGNGDGNGTDDDGCSEEDGCTGTLPSIGDAVACESFSGCLDQFYSRLVNSPILAAISNVGNSFPTGSCPVVNITMFGETNSLSAPMCDVWSGTIAPIIAVMFMVIFAWVSTRIVMSA